jgi:iron complex transport system substrate-binding protein
MRFSTTRRSLSIRLGAVALACTCAAGGAMAAAPEGSAPIQIQHAKGVTQLPAKPLRVVVYDLGALDTMHTLGLPVAGVAKAKLPDYLGAYMDGKVPSAGSLFEPDYDALSQIRPDLIIVGGRSAAKFETLSKIAPTVDFSVNTKQLLADMERNVTQISGLYGKQAQGKALVRELKTEVAELRQLAGQAQPGLLLMAINERLGPQAPGARFGFLFDVLGARSAIGAKDVPPRGTPYTFDDVTKLNPEWIYVIDRNTATGSAAGGGEIIPAPKVFDNAKVKATAAGQKNQVVFLDPKGWYLMGSAGPTALRNNVRQLKTAYTQAQQAQQAQPQATAAPAAKP